MKKLKANPGYCPDDKDIFDFFEACNPSKDNVRMYLANCGIFTSCRSTSRIRNSIAADVELDWSRYCLLEDLVPERVPKSKWTDVSYVCDLKKNEMHDLVNSIKSEIKTSPKDKVNIIGDGNIISIVIDHEVPDFSQTRLLQPVPKRSEIEIQKTSEGIQVRRSVDNKAREAVSKLDSAINKKFEENKKPIHKKIIDISQLKTAQSRIKFFFDLMDKLQNMEYHDMLGVVVSKFDEDLNLDEDSKYKSEGKIFKSFIKKADFSGEGLRSNPEISRFLSQGFFVSACTIEAIANESNLGSIVFRCGFADEIDVRIFEYKILSVKPIDAEGNVRKRSPTGLEQAKISNWINATAFEALEMNKEVQT